MSQDDELAFARFLKEGDKDLSQAYRDQGDEQPSTELDAVILAAAKAQAEQGKASTTKRPMRRNWGAPVAVAATVLLAIALVNLIPKDQRMAPSSVVMESDTLVPIQKKAPADERKLDRMEERLESFAVPAAPAPARAKAKRKLEQAPMPMSVAPKPAADSASSNLRKERTMKANEPMRRDMPATAPAMRTPAESAAMMMDEVQSRQRIQKVAPRKAQAELQKKLKASSGIAAGIMAEEEAVSSEPALQEHKAAVMMSKDADDSNQLFKEIYELKAAGRIDEARLKLEELLKKNPGLQVPDDLKGLLR